LRQKIRNWVTLRTFRPAPYAAGVSATENVMLSLRIVAGGAVFLLVSAAAAGEAAAQNATTDTPGKPLELLRIVEAPARPQAVAHNRIHTAIHRAIAARSRHHSVIAKVQPKEPTVQDAAASSVSPPHTDTAPATSVAAADPPSQAVPSPSEPVMGPLVVGNQTVDVASQSDVNAIDLAADAPANTSANASPGNGSPNDAAANPAPNNKVAEIAATAVAAVSDAASKSDSVKAAPAPPPQAAAGAIGTPGWIAQVMAAAAGAVAAGSLAWFLIGSAPQRTYG
jgi:hypothetical protein